MFRISFEYFGDASDQPVTFELDRDGFPTVRELIEVAVEKEFSLRPEDKVSLSRRQEEALSAFKRGTFAMLVDGRQVTELDDRVNAAESSDLCFIRITPLAGG